MNTEWEGNKAQKDDWNLSLVCLYADDFGPKREMWHWRALRHDPYIIVEGNAKSSSSAKRAATDMVAHMQRLERPKRPFRVRWIPFVGMRGSRADCGDWVLRVSPIYEDRWFWKLNTWKTNKDGFCVKGFAATERSAKRAATTELYARLKR